mgnify:CR=1 FL=1
MSSDCLTGCARSWRLTLGRALLLASLTVVCTGAFARQQAFDFAVIGDMPYTKVQEREYQRVLDTINATELAFVAHVGDFQFDARPCNQNPVIASTPCVEENDKAVTGDDDWSDCRSLRRKWSIRWSF